MCAGVESQNNTNVPLTILITKCTVCYITVYHFKKKIAAFVRHFPSSSFGNSLASHSFSENSIYAFNIF